MLSDDLLTVSAAFAFAVVLNLLGGVGLLLSFLGSRKPYLLFAIAAVAVEILRQLSDYLLGLNSTSYAYYGVAQALQMSSSLALCLAMTQAQAGGVKGQRGLLIGLAVFAAAVLISELGSTPEKPLWSVYLYEAPLLLINCLLLWQFLWFGPAWGLARLFGGAAALLLLLIRLALPGQGEVDNLYLFMYYVEYLLFPMMLGGLVFGEVQQAHNRVNSLLSEQTQSKKDLQFIVDNSLDVILVADHVGLLQSWSAKAREVFGYTEQQAVGKLHMDDLFVNNHWQQEMESRDEFEAPMEAMNGKTLKVRVRRQTVTRNRSTYTLFVLGLLAD